MEKYKLMCHFLPPEIALKICLLCTEPYERVDFSRCLGIQVPRVTKDITDSDVHLSKAYTSQIGMTLHHYGARMRYKTTTETCDLIHETLKKTIVKEHAIDKSDKLFLYYLRFIIHKKIIELLEWGNMTERLVARSVIALPLGISLGIILCKMFLKIEKYILKC